MTSHRARPGSLTAASWIFAALVFAALITIVAQRGDIAQVARLLRRAQPFWLLAAFGLQALTYVSAAAVWYVALRRTSHPQPLRSLVGLALAMLFSNQAVPSVGVSGGLVVTKALARRSVPESSAMAALLLGLVTSYIAFIVTFGIALGWVAHFVRRLLPVVLAVGILFVVLAGGVMYVVFNSRRAPAAWRQRLSKLPVLGRTIATFMAAPTRLLKGRVVLEATGLHFVEIMLDAATLGVAVRSVRSHASASAVFCSYVIAAVGSRVAFAPLGIGTFEAASVTMLHAGGLPLGPALAATLVFRGFTLWLPMLPGLILARRALR
jgi:uncharacterized protein (TIRG00374 family)